MPDPANAMQQFCAKLAALKIPGRDAKRLDKLLSFCGTLPEVVFTPYGERHLSMGVRRKTFAYYLNDYHGDGRAAICCKSTLGRQQELVRSDPQRYSVPPYLGVSGWVSLRIDLPRIDWDEAFELVIHAYRMQAPRKLAERME